MRQYSFTAKTKVVISAYDKEGEKERKSLQLVSFVGVCLSSFSKNSAGKIQQLVPWRSNSKDHRTEIALSLTSSVHFDQAF